MKKWLSKIHREESGQGMMEYSLFSFMILIGGSLALPTAIDNFFDAYNAYLAGFFYILSLPII
jgi:Flp pilus assembly pilin Flp